MKKKKHSRWQMILLIVCICFFIGILIGGVSASVLGSEQAERLSVYVSKMNSDNIGFKDLFFKHSKYIVAMWLSGFVYSGSLLIMIIIFIIGLFYGFSSSFVAMTENMRNVIRLFPHNSILIPAYIFMAVWSIEFVLKKFSNNGPKSRIKRERHKRLSEHIIILSVGLLINLVGCLLEYYVYL